MNRLFRELFKRTRPSPIFLYISVFFIIFYGWHKRFLSSIIVFTLLHLVGFHSLKKCDRFLESVTCNFFFFVIERLVAHNVIRTYLQTRENFMKTTPPLFLCRPFFLLVAHVSKNESDNIQRSCIVLWITRGRKLYWSVHQLGRQYYLRIEIKSSWSRTNSSIYWYQ